LPPDALKDVPTAYMVWVFAIDEMMVEHDQQAIKINSNPAQHCLFKNVLSKTTIWPYHWRDQAKKANKAIVHTQIGNAEQLF
jgi:hypothetical protein